MLGEFGNFYRVLNNVRHVVWLWTIFHTFHRFQIISNCMPVKSFHPAALYQAWLNKLLAWFSFLFITIKCVTSNDYRFIVEIIYSTSTPYNGKLKPMFVGCLQLKTSIYCRSIFLNSNDKTAKLPHPTPVLVK